MFIIFKTSNFFLCLVLQFNDQKNDIQVIIFAGINSQNKKATTHPKSEAFTPKPIKQIAVSNTLTYCVNIQKLILFIILRY